MSHQSTRSRAACRTLAAILALTSALMSRSLYAQAVTSDAGGSSYDGFGHINPCPGLPAQCNYMSPDGGLLINSSASATIAGSLQASASVRANDWGSQFQTGVWDLYADAYGFASFSDVFLLSNVPSDGNIKFNMYLAGATGGTVVGPWQSAQAFFDLNLYYAPQAGTYQAALFTSGIAGSPTLPQTYGGLYSVSVGAFTGPTPLRFDLYTGTTLGIPGAPAGTSLNGTVFSQVGASLHSIQFFDGNGVDISDQVALHAASGAFYQIGLPEDATMTVPEPGTMALMASGLVLMLGQSRRRGSRSG